MFYRVLKTPLGLFTGGEYTGQVIFYKLNPIVYFKEARRVTVTLLIFRQTSIRKTKRIATIEINFEKQQP